MDRASFNLAQFIHPDRFSAFLGASNQNVSIAENLYIWNIQVSAAFWGGFHILEITLRNVIHEKFREHANVEEWWDTDLPIHDGDRGSIQEAVAKVYEDKRSPTPGHVIAELNLGFWVGLFANNYHSALWKGRLEHVFPNFSGQRKELHVDLERLRKLRNRIAHHEPIHDRDLRIDFGTLCAVIGYIDRDVSRLVRSLSKVEAIIETKNEALAGVTRLTF